MNATSRALFVQLNECSSDVNECLLELSTLSRCHTRHHVIFESNGLDVSLAENACALRGEKGPTNSTVTRVALTLDKSCRLEHDEYLLRGLWAEHARVGELHSGCPGLDLNESENSKLRRGYSQRLESGFKCYPKGLLGLTHEIAQTSVWPSIVFAN